MSLIVNKFWSCRVQGSSKGKKKMCQKAPHLLPSREGAGREAEWRDRVVQAAGVWRISLIFQHFGLSSRFKKQYAGRYRVCSPPPPPL